MSNTKRNNICDWCNSSDIEKVGEDWIGHIYVCKDCAHEFVIPAKTKAGNDFWEFVGELLEEIEREKRKTD